MADLQALSIRPGRRLASDDLVRVRVCTAVFAEKLLRFGAGSAADIVVLVYDEAKSKFVNEKNALHESLTKALQEYIFLLADLR